MMREPVSARSRREMGETSMPVTVMKVMACMTVIVGIDGAASGKTIAKSKAIATTARRRGMVVVFRLCNISSLGQPGCGTAIATGRGAQTFLVNFRYGGQLWLAEFEIFDIGEIAAVTTHERIPAADATRRVHLVFVHAVL